MKRYWFAMFGLVWLPALAGEEMITLKDGVGKEAVVTHCALCHSLDYIQMNSQALDRTGWDKTISKMITAMGADIPKGEERILLDYLERHYGPD